ncbi:hypothetical protein BH10PAT1_BH10PAT1_0320 [soil metagenome]
MADKVTDKSTMNRRDFLKKAAATGGAIMLGVTGASKLIDNLSAKDKNENPNPINRVLDLLRKVQYKEVSVNEVGQELPFLIAQTIKGPLSSDISDMSIIIKSDDIFNKSNSFLFEKYRTDEGEKSIHSGKETENSLVKALGGIHFDTKHKFDLIVQIISSDVEGKVKDSVMNVLNHFELSNDPLSNNLFLQVEDSVFVNDSITGATKMSIRRIEKYTGEPFSIEDTMYRQTWIDTKNGDKTTQVIIDRDGKITSGNTDLDLNPKDLPDEYDYWTGIYMGKLIDRS